MRRHSLVLALAAGAFLLAAVWTASAQSDYVIIVHSDNPIASLSKEDVSRLFLKKKTRWDDDLVVDPVDLDDGSTVREGFSQDIHGRSVGSIKNYWQRQIFSGRAIPPPELANDSDVIAHVEGHRGAIGYVARGNLGSGVKIVELAE